MFQICVQIEVVYRGNSRVEVIEVLLVIVINVCVSVFIILERFVMEMMFFVIVLYGNIGIEVGKFRFVSVG